MQVLSLVIMDFAAVAWLVWAMFQQQPCTCTCNLWHFVRAFDSVNRPATAQSGDCRPVRLYHFRQPVLH